MSKRTENAQAECVPFVLSLLLEHKNWYRVESRKCIDKLDCQPPIVNHVHHLVVDFERWLIHTELTLCAEAHHVLGTWLPMSILDKSKGRTCRLKHAFELLEGHPRLRHLPKARLSARAQPAASGCCPQQHCPHSWWAWCSWRCLCCWSCWGCLAGQQARSPQSKGAHSRPGVSRCPSISRAGLGSTLHAAHRPLICVHACLCTRACTCVYMHVCMCVHMCMYVWVCRYVCTLAWACENGHAFWCSLTGLHAAYACAWFISRAPADICWQEGSLRAAAVTVPTWAARQDDSMCRNEDWLGALWVALCVETGATTTACQGCCTSTRQPHARSREGGSNLQAGS